MKSRVVKLADYIKERTLENGGETPVLQGPNGFEILFTVANYRKVRDELAKKLNIKSTKKSVE